MEAPSVTVEAHLANGLPALTLVGLPEGAVKESKDRVRSAILNSGLKFPDRRITLNLAPADLPKDGGRFDLKAVNQVIEKNLPVADLAARLGVSTHSLCAWVKRYSKPQEERQQGDDQQAELRRLRAELKRVIEERDILKKAAAYFAKECG